MTKRGFDKAAMEIEAAARAMLEHQPSLAQCRGPAPCAPMGEPCSCVRNLFSLATAALMGARNAGRRLATEQAKRGNVEQQAAKEG